MRILITGGSGQLARELMRRPAGPAIERIGLARARLDITDRAAVLDRLRDAAPDVVVNCAAYTAVDAAEADPATAFGINRDGAANMAWACAALGMPLIHLSTDYVFDGEKGTPYDEDDAVAPLNVYGASKAAGEQAVRDRHAEHLILRASWLYAAHGQNFVRTMLGMIGRPEIRVVDDQQGCPTAASDLAAAILTLAERAAMRGCAWGTYHCCNAGSATWFALASAVFQAAALAAGGTPVPRLVPVTTAEFPRPARRPHHSVLDCRRLAAGFGIEMRPWDQALAEVLGELLPADREEVD